jgi:hypothetical protein
MIPEIRPFRWNVAKREQLGRLLDGPQAETYDGFDRDLRTLAAKIMARSQDSHLVFVGRSAENAFDYLSGLFHDSSDPPRLTLLQFSDPPHEVDVIARWRPKEVASLFGYFAAERLDPMSIVSSGKQARFVDLVHTGNTFASICQLLRHWGRVQGADWTSVRSRIGFIGITVRKKNSPNTWRWQQQCDWVAEIDRSRVKNISSIPRQQWSWIGDHQEKTTPSFRIERWASSDAQLPTRDDPHLKGLRLAASLFDRGRDRHERARFAAEVAVQPEMKEAWLRARLLRLRSASTPFKRRPAR